MQASSHLADVLDSVSRLTSCPPLLGLPCTLVAFSKSGVVLNQVGDPLAAGGQHTAWYRLYEHIFCTCLSLKSALYPNDSFWRRWR